ncbi:DUF4189 domain-containing protein [Xenophilus arseniciresistens]|uniref:DUF4189 domain-containing protein n=1 Tax=Xenophilus arseniciresistens TaxID=1283306 RepID=A0AAE3NF20_9BURK|nr:DUF4189 domain-containing protein [Xenophilus arseniciresistens]MDA7418424.1 DUF4189 domain-containing protein [Xenophilus arseniciresistens]
MMTRQLIRGVLGLLLVVFASFAAHAQCSPGTILYHTPTNSYCGPDPNYTGQQQPQQRPEIWHDRYGALAVDTNGGTLGAAINMRSRSEAEKTAMDDCRAQGNTSCVLENSYRNGCTALVAHDAGYSFTTEDTLQGAIDSAFERCTKRSGKNCRLYYQGCSLPVRVR